MQLRREASVGIVAILVLQVLLALLAITLLTRMGPAIGWILQENVYSAEAVEAMLAELAAGQDEAAFDEGLARAQANVTEAEEPAVLVRIAAQRTAALAGPGPARAAVVRDLREIGAINRASMVRANGRAGRLGLGGAWAAALLGALAVGLGVLVYRRLSLRLEIPIQDVRLTLERLRAGNPQARCALLESPAELRQIAKDLNWLADRWLERSRPAAPPRGEAELRRLLAVLLDREPGPAQAVDGDDDIVAQNLAALELLAAPVAGAWEDEAVAGTTLRLRRWAPA
ncbi:MAG: hypothetical protein H6706_30975 [Myxococcales bacterium]|nr:hypothetical protein [Myxococcales bacterium]